MILEIAITLIIILMTTWVNTLMTTWVKLLFQKGDKKPVYRQLTYTERKFFLAINKSDLEGLKRLFEEEKIDPNVQEILGNSMIQVALLKEHSY